MNNTERIEKAFAAMEHVKNLDEDSAGRRTSQILACRDGFSLAAAAPDLVIALKEAMETIESLKALMAEYAIPEPYSGPDVVDGAEAEIVVEPEEEATPEAGA